MSPKKRVKAAPFTLWLIPGFLISVGLLVLSYLALAVVPWGIFGTGEPGPPERVDLPLVSSALGWFVVILTVGFTAVGIWFDRGQEKRIDPLVRIALCLSVLGIAEAISYANHRASGCIWPANLLHAAFWILLVAMAVGVLSWVRLLLARGAVRGWILAICSVFCSGGAAWYLHAHLFDYGMPLLDDGIELPIVRLSWEDWVDPDEFRPELRVTVSGAEALPDFTEIAERMKKEPYGRPPEEIPDEPVLIRADARASWTSVRDVIAKVGETNIWKIQIATRWEDPPTQTKLCFFLPRQVWIDVEGAEPPPPPPHLEMREGGRFSLDGEPIATLDALAGELKHLYRREAPDDLRNLWIDPHRAATWQEVLDVVVVATRPHRFDLKLDSLYLQVE